MSEQFAKIYTKKKYMIRSYANELEHDGEMDLNDTSKHITQVLKGILHVCIFKILEEKYEREYAVQKRTSSQFTTLEHHLDVIKT
jgi:hypothetical protein